MKVVILAGGLGTRISELTGDIPKPMAPIGGKPILHHIIELYAHYGFKEVIIALGYKGNVIKDYFFNYFQHRSDFVVDLKNGDIEYYNNPSLDLKVSLIDTGLTTMTGGRLARLRKYIDTDHFMLTYGDGLANINIQELVDFHLKSGRLGTVTAVRPIARFGQLKIEKDSVNSFKEKPHSDEGWINGGFFVFSKDFFNYLPENDGSILEKEPLENLANDGQLSAYTHDGFWQCMDTLRDFNYLNDLCTKGRPPWQKK